MNAMLDPRMVAVRIQTLASDPHGLPSPADRIMASSQGAFMQAIDASLSGITSEKTSLFDRGLVGGHSQETPTLSRDRPVFLRPDDQHANRGIRRSNIRISRMRSVGGVEFDAEKAELFACRFA